MLRFRCGFQQQTHKTYCFTNKIRQTHIMECSICNNTLKGKYCEKCGQSYSNKQLNFRTVLADLVASIANLEKNIFLNLYTIVRFPKKVINNYWEGFRGHYYKPGKVLFYFITAAGISILVLEKEMFGLIFNIDSEYAVPEGLIFSLMFLPILSLSSFLCYRRYKRHYIEHLIASIYLFSTFGIIVLIVQHLATYLFNLESNDDRWFLLLIGATTLWNAMVFTAPKNYR